MWWTPPYQKWHQPAGEPDRDMLFDQEGQRNQHENHHDRQADPDRRADQRLLIRVMGVVHLFDVGDVVQDVAVQQIFDQRP